MYSSRAAIAAIFALATGIGPSVIEAATVSTSTTVTLAVGTTPGTTLTDTDADTANSPQTFVSSSSSVSGSADIASGTADAFASANSDTGELKVSTSNTRTLDPGITYGGYASGLSTASIGETVLLNGTGTLTISMLVDVSWDVLSSWQAQAKVQIGSVLQDVLVLGQSNSGQSGSIDDYMLSVSTNYASASNLSVDLLWSMFVQDLGSGLGGSSLIDASHTGTIWFDTSGSLLATPSDSSFLANAVYPSDLSNTTTVPLPASLPLLLAGLAGFGLTARQRRR